MQSKSTCLSMIGSYIIGSDGKDYPRLKCSCCGETPPLKSNRGISEEVSRISSYRALAKKVVSCPHEECSNHTVAVGTKKAYRSFGASSSGSKRYQCVSCNKTFSIAKPLNFSTRFRRGLGITPLFS